MATLGAGELAPLEARMGIMRLGQARLGGYSTILFVTVDGVELDTVQLLRGTKIVHTLGQPSTATIKVMPTEAQVAAAAGAYGAPYGSPYGGGAAIPVLAGQEVQIAFGDPTNVDFGGHVWKIEDNRQGTKVYSYTCQCRDYSYKFDKRRVNAKFGAMNDTAMAQAIVDDWTDPADGFTFNALSGGVSIAGLQFKNTRPGDGLSRIARQSGARYRIGPDKVVTWWQGQEPGVQNPAPIVLGSVSYEKLDWTNGDVGQVKTRIRVEGMETQLTVAATAGDTALTVEDISAYSASGGSAMLGVDEVTYTGVSGSQLTGIPASGTGSIQNNWPVGTEISILVIVDDSAAQAVLAAREGGDGVHIGDPIIDRRLSIAGAEERAAAELLRYSSIAEGGDVTASEDRFMSPGRVLAIDLPYRGIDGEYLIQQVTRRYRSPSRLVQDVKVGPYRADLVDMLASQTLSAGEVG